MPAIVAITVADGVLVFVAGMLLGGALVGAILGTVEAFARRSLRHPSGPLRS
jgi:hypothetical protein